MNVFETHAHIIADYAKYIQSFVNIADKKINDVVQNSLSQGKLWPQPLLQFNPAYKISGKIDEIVDQGSLHPDLKHVFGGYSLYQHQTEAIQLGRKPSDFVVTSGTGSGKSLTYIATIFDYLLNQPNAEGIVGIIVYPMNALINSQTIEFNGYRDNYSRVKQSAFPISYGQFTGQEGEERREEMRSNPPHILLTNYMMLELLLTRTQERRIRDAIFKNLRFLVFDELHTYRGRQGADVALLIRRIQAQAQHKLTCIGTSATMVSVGSHQSKQAEVANFATTIFGRSFDTDQIVDETLARSLEITEGTLNSGSLRAAIEQGIDPSGDETALKQHPLAVWLENEVALDVLDDRLVRRTPQTIQEVIQRLIAASGASEKECRVALRETLFWISKVNQSIQDSGSKYTILPYKLHQFISQTGSVYTTLDQDENRHITLEPGIYQHDDDDQKPIFQNVFSRATGYPFICVSLGAGKLLPREFRASSEDDEVGEDGYLIIGDDVWNPEEDLEYLPEAWVRVRRNGSRVPESKKIDRFPRRIYFDEFGNYSETNKLKYEGWFMLDPLLFDPTGGVFYDAQTSEGTKLTKLGSEGRSTSTTITGFSILNRLHDAGFEPKDQKLLSFTDNRQDAALQAGHFNDYVQVLRLRAAIRKALEDSPSNTLQFSNIGEAVFEALDLPFTDFANRDSEPPIAAIKKKYELALQEFLLFRALADLRRSWRIVLPNLEQCALLDVDYEDLREVAEADDYWDDTIILRDIGADERYEFISRILDYYRLEYAIYSENYLRASKLKEFERQFRETLKAPWTLDNKEVLRSPCVIRLDPLNRRAHLTNKSMGPASSLGKYIKHFAQSHGIDSNLLKRDGYRDFILQLMNKLTEVDFLYAEIARSNRDEEVPVYRLRINKILWKLGDGITVKPDVIKRRSYRDQAPKPNEYFREIYQRDFTKTKRLAAADHTGQLNVETRLDRENRFRAEWYLDEEKKQVDYEKVRRDSISALFCSPTMELGVDIGGLSVVHMRNAPPNPANYVQRSGRAGRSGQGALVFTYCSGFSPHDRHYFQHQPELVAGAVQAPRIDLCNRELLLTHLNALTVSEIGLPGLEAQGGDRPSLVHLILEDNAELPLQPGVKAGLKISPKSHTNLKATFQKVIADFSDQLTMDDHSWYTDEWIEHSLNHIVDQLDDSMERWRKLYHSAKAILLRATNEISSGLLKTGSEPYRKFKRLQDQANRQLNLLRNEQAGSAELTEFYPYRYLASEGFLPGYNFTRLPLRFFVPTGDTSGEFISRPRTIAIREFGPLNIIYHNGRKYRVSQLVVQDAESSLQEAIVSTKSGYYLSGDQMNMEFCPFSKLPLGDNANKEHIHHLLEMSESRGQEVERITCEEEERVSRGFDVSTYFSIDGGDFDRIKKAKATTDGVPLLNLRFIPAARLIQVNLKWRAQRTKGFPLGLTSGNWRGSMPEEGLELSEEYQRVKLLTSSLADALYIEPIEALGLDPNGVVSLQYAIKRAIEKVFKVEPSEISVQAMGDPESPNIMVYESAEGSLGILSRFVEKVDAFRDVINRAIEICRYDDEEYKAPASYDDLLSYYNQRDHLRVDRFLIQDALKKLSIANVELKTSPGFTDYESQYQYMLKHLDPNSSTERKFIDHLYKHRIRLPDAAQKRVTGIYCQPDFYYEPRFWVFCDGTPHDDPQIQAKDEAQRQQIIALGDDVWSWHYNEDLDVKIKERSDIFRKVK